MTTASEKTYKVELDSFAGPLDLLLYLIRKEEVDIYDIPIDRILEQYMAFLEMIQQIDLDEAGDFLVMASTLMVIKSRMLLPIEEVDLSEELDPRYELVQQLLDYKRLKARGAALRDRAEIASKRVGRPESVRPEDHVEEDRSLEEVSIWDIFRFFEKVQSETTIRVRADRVLRGRQVPVREYASRLEERLRAGPVFLRELVGETRSRDDFIGYFLAVLLLVKTQMALAVQSGEFGEIRLIARRAVGSETAEQEVELADDFRD